MAVINTICFTGHQPQKLGDFEQNPIMDYVKAALRGAIERAVKQKVETFIPGGALGVDQWAADIVLELRAEELKKSYISRSNIKLIVAQQFPSQSAKWPQENRRHYDKMLQKAVRIIAVSDDPYSAKMGKRKEWVVDNSDTVIAVWDGSAGWTAETVKYGEKKGKPVLVIDPKEESERWILNRTGRGWKIQK